MPERDRRAYRITQSDRITISLSRVGKFNYFNCGESLVRNISYTCNTSSSAVAKRPRDTSYLLVVSFIASIVQYLERSFFIISYFDFKFTNTYNSILFYCLRRHVEPCWHTHDSRTTMNVYSVRPRLVGLVLYTVTDNRDCVQRVALGRPIPAVNGKPVANCKMQTRVQQLLIAKPDIQ